MLVDVRVLSATIVCLALAASSDATEMSIPIAIAPATLEPASTEPTDTASAVSNAHHEQQPEQVKVETSSNIKSQGKDNKTSFADYTLSGALWSLERPLNKDVESLNLQSSAKPATRKSQSTNLRNHATVKQAQEYLRSLAEMEEQSQRARELFKSFTPEDVADDADDDGEYTRFHESLSQRLYRAKQRMADSYFEPSEQDKARNSNFTQKYNWIDYVLEDDLKSGNTKANTYVIEEKIQLNPEPYVSSVLTRALDTSFDDYCVACDEDMDCVVGEILQGKMYEATKLFEKSLENREAMEAQISNVPDFPQEDLRAHRSAVDARIKIVKTALGTGSAELAKRYIKLHDNLAMSMLEQTRSDLKELLPHETHTGHTGIPQSDKRIGKILAHEKLCRQPAMSSQVNDALTSMAAAKKHYPSKKSAKALKIHSAPLYDLPCAYSDTEEERAATLFNLENAIKSFGSLIRVTREVQLEGSAAHLSSRVSKILTKVCTTLNRFVSRTLISVYGTSGGTLKDAAQYTPPNRNLTKNEQRVYIEQALRTKINAAMCDTDGMNMIRVISSTLTQMREIFHTSPLNESMPAIKLVWEALQSSFKDVANAINLECSFAVVITDERSSINPSP